MASPENISFGPLDPAEVAGRANEPLEDPAAAAQLRQLHTAVKEESLGGPFDVDPSRVEQAGWAVVFSTEEGVEVGRILLGQPVGYAMKDFNEKYAALSANLARILED